MGQRTWVVLVFLLGLAIAQQGHFGHNGFNNGRRPGSLHSFHQGGRPGSFQGFQHGGRPGGHRPRPTGHFGSHAVHEEATCVYTCRVPNTNVPYCCMSKAELKSFHNFPGNVIPSTWSPSHYKPGHCPESTCLRGHPLAITPKFCAFDDFCAGTDKCCYDTCLQGPARHICKPSLEKVVVGSPFDYDYDQGGSHHGPITGDFLTPFLSGHVRGGSNSGGGSSSKPTGGSNPIQFGKK